MAYSRSALHKCFLVNSMKGTMSSARVGQQYPCMMYNVQNLIMFINLHAFVCITYRLSKLAEEIEKDKPIKKTWQLACSN